MPDHTPRAMKRIKAFASLLLVASPCAFVLFTILTFSIGGLLLSLLLGMMLSITIWLIEYLKGKHSLRWYGVFGAALVGIPMGLLFEISQLLGRIIPDSAERSVSYISIIVVLIGYYCCRSSRRLKALVGVCVDDSNQ